MAHCQRKTLMLVHPSPCRARQMGRTFRGHVLLALTFLAATAAPAAAAITYSTPWPVDVTEATGISGSTVVGRYSTVSSSIWGNDSHCFIYDGTTLTTLYQSSGFVDYTPPWWRDTMLLTCISGSTAVGIYP